MKKVLWLALFAAVIFSCKDDDDGNVNVTGTWLLVSQASTNCDDPDNNHSRTDDDGCDDGTCQTIKFSNGSYTSTDLDGGDEYTDTGTYKVKGSKLTIDGTITVTVTRSGNTLTLVNQDADGGCDVTTTLTKVD